MTLGTIDRTPPPFFRHGPSALTKLVVFSALALFLMVADTRFRVTQPMRAALATVLHFPQQWLALPVQAWDGTVSYFSGLQKALTAEEAARSDLMRQAERAMRVEQLLAENTRLRALLELRPSAHGQVDRCPGAVRRARPVLAQDRHRPVVRLRAWWSPRPSSTRPAFWGR